jgi:hypothetical protein
VRDLSGESRYFLLRLCLGSLRERESQCMFLLLVLESVFELLHLRDDFERLVCALLRVLLRLFGRDDLCFRARLARFEGFHLLSGLLARVFQIVLQSTAGLAQFGQLGRQIAVRK